MRLGLTEGEHVNLVTAFQDHVKREVKGFRIVSYPVDRPALQRLLGDIRAGQVDVVVVYKIDRLTRSLFDFAKIVEAFDARGISFVSITQQFNTTTSMGRAYPERAALLRAI